MKIRCGNQLCSKVYEINSENTNNKTIKAKCPNCKSINYVEKNFLNNTSFETHERNKNLNQSGSNKSFLFNFINSFKDTSKNKNEEISDIEEKSMNNPAINMLLKNFNRSNLKNSNLTYKETRDQKEKRKENRKKLNQINKQNKNLQKELQKELYRERKKYLLAKAQFTKLESEFYSKLNKLENSRKIYLNSLKNKLDNEALFLLNQSSEKLENEIENLNKEITKTSFSIKELAKEISEFIKNVPKKLISDYDKLSKEYLFGDKDKFHEAAKNLIQYNKPWLNEKIEIEINKMKMSTNYMNLWINTNDVLIKKCPGGCTSSIGRPKRVYRDITSAKKFALDNQYTYFDANCGLGFHNSSRKNGIINNQIIKEWVNNFEKILKLNNLQLSFSDLQKSFNEKQNKIKLLQTQLAEQNDFNEVKLNKIDTEIESLNVSFNREKNNFVEMESNYLQYGKFLLDIDLKKTA